LLPASNKPSSKPSSRPPKSRRLIPSNAPTLSNPPKSRRMIPTTEAPPTYAEMEEYVRQNAKYRDLHGWAMTIDAHDPFAIDVNNGYMDRDEL